MTQSQVLLLGQCLQLELLPGPCAELCLCEGLAGPAELFCRSCSGHAAAWGHLAAGNSVGPPPLAGERKREGTGAW